MLNKPRTYIANHTVTKTKKTFSTSMTSLFVLDFFLCVLLSLVFFVVCLFVCLFDRSASCGIPLDLKRV